jgi:hypothetical protein
LHYIVHWHQRRLVAARLLETVNSHRCHRPRW